MVTTLAKYDGDYGDNSMIIASNDPTEQTMITEDFCFDARVAAGFSSGALPAAGAAFPAAGLISVARDDQPALSRLANAAAIGHPAAGTPQTTLTPSVAGTSGLVTSLGIDFTAATPAYIRKTGVADNVVGHPPTEGFMDHLMMAWVRMGAVPGGLNAFGSTINGGIRFGGSLVPIDAVNNALTFGAALSIGLWYLLGIHYDFDVEADTTIVRRFLNGLEVGAAAAGIGPKAYVAAPSAANRCAVGGQSGSANFPGIIARPTRIYTAVPGFLADPAAIVASRFANERAIFGA
jgi:hypothetical protein